MGLVLAVATDRSGRAVAESLFSTSWYRVAGLRPRLRSHTQIHRHLYRGQVWYVLQDHASGRFHRFTPEANLVIGLMNGERSMQEIWEQALGRLGNDVPTQDEIVKLLSDLHRADALQTHGPLDLAELHQRRRAHRRMRIKQYIGNPLSLRIPLMDPDRWLERWRPWLAPLFGWGGALLWLAVVGMGVVLAVMHWSALTSGTLDQVFSAQNLLLMWMIFPVVKIVHELAHAVVTKAGGGEVHELGVMLLVLMPIPYVDASAASAFRSKQWRMLAGFAGIGVELFIAALALLAWVHLEPGLPRAVAYNVLLLTGASALIFNGNPLLRYDGYYILSDAIEIPNLAQRANDYYGHLFKRHVLGRKDAEPPHVVRGERGWFLFYGVASLAYRLWITLAIVFLVASQFFFIGIVLALWCLWTMVAQPLMKTLLKLRTLLGHGTDGRSRAWAGVAAFVLLLVAVLGWLPLPSTTRAEGVVWAPERTQVRAAVDGFVTRVVARPGSAVRQGQVLIECQDPELLARQRRVRAELAELQARADAARVSSRVEAAILEQQIAQMGVAADLIDRRLAGLTLRAPLDGVFVLPAADDLPGRYLQRGDLVADVLDAATTVRVVVPQAAKDRVRAAATRVEVRSAARVGEVLPARIAREVPAATDELPSLTLSLQGGGQIGLDPSRPDNPRSIDKLFVLDLELPAGAGFRQLGGRVFVRFEHAPEPLAVQAWRGLRHLLLRRLDI